MAFELVVDNRAAVELPLPPLDVVRVTMGQLGENVKEFGTALNAELAAVAEPPTDIPLAVYDATKKAVTVYPNIVLPRADIAAGVLSSKYCDLFSVKFYNDIATDIFAKKWDNPETALNRHEMTTLPRFLTKVLAKGTADNIIRDMAQRLEDAFMPPKLIFTKTVDDWKEMFTCNAASCMRVGNYQYVKKDPGEEFLKQGKWVSEYYSYWPNATGVYIKKNDAVVARAVLYKHDPENDDKYMGHSYPYGVTDPFRLALNKELNKLCPQLSGTPVPMKMFTGPVHEINGKKYAIHCSCDDISNSHVKICYDKTNDVVMYGLTGYMPERANSVAGHNNFSNNGFILIKELHQHDGVRNEQKAA